MKQIKTALLLFVSLSFLTSCASTQQKGWLKAHQSQLTQLANSNASPEAKADGLLTDYVVLMDEGLKFVNPVKGVKYIKKYYTQNETTMTKIVNESSTWTNNLNDAQAIGFGLRVIQKPYIRSFIELVPKFKRKYETYRFIMEMTGKVAGGFGKIGQKAVGL